MEETTLDQLYEKWINIKQTHKWLGIPQVSFVLSFGAFYDYFKKYYRIV